MKLTQTIRAYHEATGEHSRYRSWEHCYRFFQKAGPKGIKADQKRAALNLAFYLASWGMYRGSSFLLQYAYTVHVPAVRVLARKQFSGLWKLDMGTDPSHAEMIPLLKELMEEVRRAYGDFAIQNGSKLPSDTLVTKVILGTLGCVPACDQLFLTGLKRYGMKYSAANELFLGRILEFCQENLPELRAEQNRILEQTRFKYPLMKLIDMHFWQWGLIDANASRK